MVSDVSLALIDAGTSIDALKTFADKQLRKPSIIQPPQRATEPSKPRALSTNRSTSKPPYIHDNLPSFPDKHSYIQVCQVRAHGLNLFGCGRALVVRTPTRLNSWCEMPFSYICCQEGSRSWCDELL